MPEMLLQESFILAEVGAMKVLSSIIKRNLKLYKENVKMRTALKRIVKMYREETDAHILAKLALENK